MDEYQKVNLANWEERVDGHMAPDGYGVDELVNTPEALTAVVRHDAEKIGNVSGLSLLHSQCHIWMPDIDEWARVMASFVKPGGRFWIRDSHPALMALDDGRDDDQLIVKFPYFHQHKPINFPDTESYAGSATLENTDSYSWAHSIADVITALINAGLVLEQFEEYQHLDWQFLSFMEKTDDDTWVLPQDVRDNVPMQFSILASKPAPAAPTP